MARKTNVMVSSTLRAVGVTTVITSILWTTIAVYNAIKQPVDLQISPAILAPVSPNIDMETVNQLKERRQLTDEPVSEEVLKQAAEVLVIEPAREASAAAPTAAPESSAAATPGQ